MMTDDFLIPGKATLCPDNVIRISPTLVDEKSQKDEPIYLSEFMRRLPSNCIFLKGVTGCGATSLAIADTSNCIIALPTRNTVLSKWVKRNKQQEITGYNNDVFCIFGGFNDKLEDLSTYIRLRQSAGLPIKIVCTYDQVEHLVNRMVGRRKLKKNIYVPDEGGNALFISPDMYRLYIDEIHQVLEDYKTPSRRGALRGMLNCIGLFSNVTCITATPLESQYFFDEIKHLPIVRVDYKFEYPLIEKRDSLSLGADCANIVISHIEDKAFGNAHIFVNNVGFIVTVVKLVATRLNMTAKQVKEQIRVVCGDTEINRAKIERAISKINLSHDYIEAKDNGVNPALAIGNAISKGAKDKAFKDLPLASINSPVKRINFYTATAFLGADIYDTTGQMYIISDNTKPYMMADISTSYIQIIGRIRDSQNNHVIHLAKFSDSRYLSEEGLKAQYERDQIKRDGDRAMIYEDYERRGYSFFKDYMRLEAIESSCYLVLDDEDKDLRYDKYLQWGDEVTWKIVTGQYLSSANMSAKLMEKGFKVEEGKTSTVDKLKANPKSRVSFEQLFKQYASLKAEGNAPLTQERITYLESIDSLVADAYSLLGQERVNALGYKRKEIQKEIDVMKQIKAIEQIKTFLKSLILKGRAYTPDNLISIANSVSKGVGVSKINIRSFCEFSPTSARADGKTIKAYMLKKFYTTSQIIERIMK